LSDEELDRIECRVAAATDGPWCCYVEDQDSAADRKFIELGICNELGTCKLIEVTGATVADQDFIANARQDLPGLLQEVRYLRARLQSLSTQMDQREPLPARSVVASAGFPLSPSR
jgi:hypothetical protein